MSEINRQIANLDQEERELLEMLLDEEGVDLAQTLIIPEDRRANPFPASFAQERLWFLQQVEPENPFYNIAKALRLSGRLDLGAFQRTLDEIVRRHEALRTVFPAINGEIRQLILEPQPAHLAVVDLTNLSPIDQEAELQHLARNEARQTFDLENGPLLRLALLRLEDQNHVLLFRMHHIIGDGWSAGVLVQELVGLYAAFSKNETSPFPALAVQYADFAVWQRKRLQDEVLKAELDYWKDNLSGPLPVLCLPTDRPRTAIQTTNGARLRIDFSKDFTNTLNGLSRREGVTLFMTLLGAFKALLYRYTRDRDLIVGTPVANRNQADLEHLIGFFVNTLALRTRITEQMTFKSLLGQIRDTALGAYAHQDVPFEKVVEEINPARTLSHTPIFQLWFALQNAPIPHLHMPGLSLLPLEIDSESSQFELTFELWQTPNGLGGCFEYNSDLFDGETIARMSRHFETLLADAAHHADKRLSELNLLSDAERENLLVDFQGSSVPVDADVMIQDLFCQQVGRTPDALALIADQQQLSYGELDRRSNQLARLLKAKGVGTDDRVGICMLPCVDMYVSILAVLKSGGAYVPVDVKCPIARQKYMLKDAAVKVVLTSRESGRYADLAGAEVIDINSQLEEISRQGDGPVQGFGSGLDAAYVIYTSGSTGEPKGAEVSHRSLVNYAVAVAEAFKLNRNDRVLQFASPGFDVVIEELFPIWIRGGAVVGHKAEAISSGAELVRDLAAEQVTVVELPTVYWEQLLEEQEREGRAGIGGLRLMIVGCEGVERHKYERWQRQGIELMHVYGLTETTVTTTICNPAQVADQSWEKMPIGRVVANTQVYILGEAGEEVPVGVVGELFIAGEGLARGYVGMPAPTAARFLPNPYAARGGARLYRTGDLARYRPTGDIEFIGRTDSQIKLRGYRVELGEIETILGRHPAIRKSVVTVKEYSPDDKRLVAYFVVEEAASVTVAEIRDFLKDHLPAYMIPAAYVALEAIPLTANGKIDEKALPDPHAAPPEMEAALTPPGNEMEKTIAAIWQECLRRNIVGREDNFFDLGGHSLMTLQVQNKLRQALNKEVSIITLFKYPTISSLATYLGESPVTPASFEQSSARADLRVKLANNRRRLREELRAAPDWKA